MPLGTRPPEQHRTLSVADSALPCVVKRAGGLVPLHAPLSARALSFPWGRRGFCQPGLAPSQRGGCGAGSVQRTFGSDQRRSPPSPLPHPLLNPFKLGERGEEVRPFGEAT